MEEKDLNVYRSLNKYKVKYLLVGGIACIIYGSPRVTKDVDIFIEATLDNSARLLKALQNCRFGTAYLTTPEKILNNELTQLKDYIHLDVLTKVKGLIFRKAWSKRRLRQLNGVRIFVLGIDDLILSKKQAGRDIDLGDVKILKKVKAMSAKRLKR